MSLASETPTGNVNVIKNMLEQGRSIEKYNFTLFDVLPCNAFVYSPITGEIVYMNTAFANSIGISKQEQSTYITLSQLLDDKESDSLLIAELEIFDSLTEGETHAFDVRLKHSSGLWNNYTLKG